MGIDIEFHAVIPQVLSEEDVVLLFEDMKILFRAEQNIDKITIIKQEKLEWALDDSFTIPENHTLLDFHTLCRLYSEGYERGYPLPWIEYAEYLEWRYPGSYVSYGGDCYKCISPWTKEKLTTRMGALNLSLLIAWLAVGKIL